VLKPKNYYINKKRESYSGNQRNHSITDKIKDISESVFKISLFIGIVISWAYFSFYVGVMPSFTSIGDVTGYLVFIVIWALITSILIILLLLPTLLLKQIIENTNIKSAFAMRLSMSYIALVPLILYFFILEDNIKYTLFGMTFLPVIFVYILYKVYGKNVDYEYSALFFIYFMYSFITLMTMNILYDQSHTVIFPFFLVLVMLYYFVLVGKYSYNGIAIFSIGFLIAVSIVLALFKIDNPIITMPFEKMKIGYYKAEIHFKKEFIEQANPFKYNDKNITFANFFVLSSIGDDYIVREYYSGGRKGKIKNSQSEDVFYPIILHQGDYWIKQYFMKDDSYDIWKSNEANEFERVDINDTALSLKLLDFKEYIRDLNDRIYIIKKSNIDYVKIDNDAYSYANTSWIDPVDLGYIYQTAITEDRNLSERILKINSILKLKKVKMLIDN